MLSAVPVLSRRRLLAGSAALALLGVAASACDTAPPPPALDGLLAQLRSARHDADLAIAAVTAAPPEVVPALTVVAAERTRHAEALAAEIARVSGEPAPGSTTAPSGPVTPAGPAPSASDVIAALRASAEGAGQLAAASSGYPAGLLGSIAAACTAAATVALTAGEPQR